ncbi:MAG TPA: ice-binding family protein [Clostridium sp.]|uniref:ice-binding family protein n=1 Tax=Clostridium sp. TaxID=1506 RepID=UPI002F9459D1
MTPGTYDVDGTFQITGKLTLDAKGDPNGVFVSTISKENPMFGKGKQLGKDYFEIMEGVKMFFYDSDSIKQEFGKYGLIEFSEIDEPHKNKENKPPFKFIMVKCQKEL